MRTDGRHREVRGPSGWIAASLLLALGNPAPSSAQSPDSTATPIIAPTLSYWGPLPARVDSVARVHESTPRKAWEWPLFVTWEVVKFPFWLVHWPIEKSTIWLDESGTIYRIRELLRPAEVPFGIRAGVSAGQKVGFAVGLGFYHDRVFGGANHAQVKVGASTTGHSRASAGMTMYRGDRGTYFEWGGGYRYRPNARYHGLGPNSRAEDESFFTQESSWGGAIWNQALFGELAGQISVLYTVQRNRGPARSQDQPALADLFAGDLPSGYGERSDGFQTVLALEHDTSLGTARPRSGGVRRLTFGHFQPDGDRGRAFWNYRVEVQQFIHLWRARVIALRAMYSRIDEAGVHFQRLMINDDPDLLRGYHDFRFRDRGMTVLSAEYRYPVWAQEELGALGVDGYVFFDWGQVFDHHDQINPENLRESLGFGFRLVGSRGLSGRMEFGFSDEGYQFRLRTDQVFQFSKRGLYHGREPVPSR